MEPQDIMIPIQPELTITLEPTAEELPEGYAFSGHLQVWKCLLCYSLVEDPAEHTAWHGEDLL